MRWNGRDDTLRDNEYDSNAEVYAPAVTSAFRRAPRRWGAPSHPRGLGRQSTTYPSNLEVTLDMVTTVLLTLNE